MGNAKPGCTAGLGDSLGNADQCLAGIYFVLQRNGQLLEVSGLMLMKEAKFGIRIYHYLIKYDAIK